MMQTITGCWNAKLALTPEREIRRQKLFLRGTCSHQQLCLPLGNMKSKSVAAGLSLQLCTPALTPVEGAAHS